METDNLKNVIDNLYDEILEVRNGEKLTLSNGVSFCVNLMQLVEKYTNFSGSQKKQIVIDVINKIIEVQVDDVNLEKDLINFSNSVLPNTIDIIVSVDRKKLVIKTKKIFKYIYDKICCCCN